ncbi:MAG: helix-turn-helix domain-containing protein [Candidatus Omnitrophota bacterium]|nr:helix-turn-helix domain-containing protein [Candidatus Omnitrophota bacterium]
MGRLMDINELADYLKVEKQTIYNWLHLKKISGIKMGHVWRFKKREIDEWLRGQHREARPSKKGMKKND